MNRLAHRTILHGAANVDTPVGLCTNIFTQGHHPTSICHERVNGEGTTGIEPIFIHAGFKAGSKRNKGILQTGKRIPTGFI